MSEQMTCEQTCERCGKHIAYESEIGGWDCWPREWRLVWPKGFGPDTPVLTVCPDCYDEDADNTFPSFAVKSYYGEETSA